METNFTPDLFGKFVQIAKSRKNHIWFKTGHSDFYRGDLDPNGNLWIQKAIRNEQRGRKLVGPRFEAYQFLRSQSETLDGGVFFLPGKPSEAPLKKYHNGSDLISCEMDEGTSEVQEARLQWFHEFSGLEFALIITSGGKSRHAHLKSSEWLSPGQRIYLQKLLSLSMRSDPAVVAPHQPMRAPGFFRKEKGKEQELLSWSDRQYSFGELVKGFSKIFESLGWNLPEPSLLSDKNDDPTNLWSELRRFLAAAKTKRFDFSSLSDSEKCQKIQRLLKTDFSTHASKEERPKQRFEVEATSKDTKTTAELRHQLQQIHKKTPISLIGCLYKSYREDIAHGVGSGDRDNRGYQISVHLQQVGDFLAREGITTDDNARSLFSDYCRNCVPALDALSETRLWHQGARGRFQIDEDRVFAAVLRQLGVGHEIHEIFHGIPSPEGLAKIEAKIGEPLGDRSFWEWAAVSNEPIFLTTKENTQKLLNQGYLALGASDAWRFYQKETSELHPALSPFLKVGIRRQFYLLFPSEGEIESLACFKLARLLAEKLQKVAKVIGDASNVENALKDKQDIDFDTKVKTAYLDCFKFTPGIEINERYLPERLEELALNHKITAIRSAKNTGKSVWLGSFLKRNKFGSLNPFQVNSLANARDFDYQRLGLSSSHIKGLHDGSQAFFDDIESHVLFCYDSIFKIPLDACDDKYLVLDEAFGGLLHAINGGTCRQRREEILSRLATYCQRAKGIILLEAELNDQSVKLISELGDIGPEAIAKVKNLYQPNPGAVQHWLGSTSINDKGELKQNAWDYTPLLRDCLYAVGRAFDSKTSVAIPTDSKNFAKTLGSLCERIQANRIKEYGIDGQGFDRQILNVHQDSKGNPEVQDFLEDPTGYMLRVKPLVWIYSPTVRQGLSIEESVDFFSAVYGFRFHLSTQGFTQMLGRVRMPVVRKIWSVPYLLSEQNVKFTESSILRGFKDSIQSEAERYNLQLNLKAEQQAKGFEDGAAGTIEYDFSVDKCSDRDLENFQNFAAFGLKLDNLDRARLRGNLQDFYQEETTAEYSERWVEKTEEHIDIKISEGVAKENWAFAEGVKIVTAEDIGIETAQEMARAPKNDAEVWMAKKALLLHSLPGIEINLSQHPSLETCLSPELAIFLTELDRQAGRRLKLRWQLLNSDRSSELRRMTLDYTVASGSTISPYLLTDYRSDAEIANTAKDCGLLDILEIDGSIDEFHPTIQAIAKKLNHKHRQWLAGKSSGKPGSKLKQINRLLGRFGWQLRQQSKKESQYFLKDNYATVKICKGYNKKQDFEISKIINEVCETFFLNREISTKERVKTLNLYLAYLWLGKSQLALFDFVNPDILEPILLTKSWDYLEVIESKLIQLHEITPETSTQQEIETQVKRFLDAAFGDVVKMGGDGALIPIRFNPQSPPTQTVDIAPLEVLKNQNESFSIQKPSNDQTSLEPQKAISSPIDAPSDYEFSYSEEDEYGIDEIANNAYQDAEYLAWVRGEEIGNLEGDNPTTKPTPREELETWQIEQLEAHGIAI